jgi:hypothetical protein
MESSVEDILIIIGTTNIPLPDLPRISFEIFYVHGEYLPFLWMIIYLHSSIYWDQKNPAKIIEDKNETE